MNFRITLILAIVLLLLAAGLFWVKSRPDEPKKLAGQNTPLIEGAPKVKSLTYSHDGVTVIAFTREGEAWRMTEPMKAAVETFKIESITNTLSSISYSRKFEPEAAPSAKSPEYTGTAKPRDVVKFIDDAGKEHTINFGKISAEGVFATYGGAKTIYVLTADPIEQLEQKPDSFRNKQIKTVDIAKIVKLEVKANADTTTLEKSNGKWLIALPVSARANAAVIDVLVNQFANITALNFSKLDKKTAGTATPTLTVTAYIDESPTTAPATTSAPATQPERKLTPITLQFGVFLDLTQREMSPIYASLADSNEVFTYSRENFKNFNKELKDLRDPAITPAAVGSATDVVVTEGPSTVSLSKKNNQWQLTAPLDLRADYSVVSQYLNHIRELRAIKFVDHAGNLPVLGLDPPQMKIEIAVPGQSQREVILVGKPETADAVTPLMRQGEPTVYLVQTKELDALKLTPVSVRDREIADLDPESIRSIEIKGAAATPGIAATMPATGPATRPTTGPATSTAATAPALPPGITIEKQITRWMLNKDGKTQAPDDSKIQSLVSAFAPLAALKYVDDKPHASGTTDVTVTITLLERTPQPTTLPVTTAPAATAPAAAPATGPATAATTGPATTQASQNTEPLPAIPVIGVDPGKIVTRTLRLYKTEADGKTTWKAVWEDQSPTWTFEPSPALIDLLTKETFNPGPPTTVPVVLPNFG